MVKYFIINQTTLCFDASVLTREGNELPMGNMLDYIRITTETLKEKPFCEVDSLILSQIAYLNLDLKVPGPESNTFIPVSTLNDDELLEPLTRGTFAPEPSKELIRLLVESPRFSSLRIGAHINRVDSELQAQFSATTFLLEDETFIGFRGTDNSYVAWRENCNLAYACPIPSQTEGLAYLQRIATQFPGTLRMGGHSKGGNIAIYAFLLCEEELQDRIFGVYSHDGPGFPARLWPEETYAALSQRIYKTIPQSSLIGLLMSHGEACTVVQSQAFWLMQHDPFTWIIDGDGFASKDENSFSSRYISQAVNTWILTMAPDGMADFSDALYQFLTTFGGSTFSDMPTKWYKATAQVFSGLRRIERGNRKRIFNALGLFIILLLPRIPKPTLPASFPTPASVFRSIARRASRKKKLSEN